MHVVIVGNGIAGVTAARTLRKRDRKARITLVSGESAHHWSRPALMYIYMGHMRFADTKPYADRFWSKNRIDLVQAWVTAIDTEHKVLTLDGTRSLGYDKLLLAVGSQPNKFGWPGQDLKRVGGMVSLQDLAALEAASTTLRHAAIVGGGLIGVELAEMLHSRGIHVTFLIRETGYWSNVLPKEEAAMVSHVIQQEGIDLRLETELREIIDDGTGQACAIVDSRGDRTEVGFVGLTAGVRPNLAVCGDSGITTDRGICVDRTLATSAPDVWAAGDCAQVATPEGERDLIQAVWYTGRMQGEVVARNICGESVDYDSGIWFNSAKFFDLEYQVYGEVPSARAPADGAESLYWEHPSRRHAIRVVHRGGTVVGFNVMGVRFRHRVCEAWIAERRSVDHVLEHLAEAHFDPELGPRHYRELQAIGGAP